jgi:anti-sigma B factor antagonist
MFPRVEGGVIASTMNTDFKAQVTDLGGGVATVVVAGEADLYTAPELKEALNEAVAGGARRVLLDLSASTFIDSTTLGVLLGAVRRLYPLGGEMAIACPDPNIRRIFEITALDRVFRIFEDAAGGLDYLRGEPVAPAA